MTARKLIWAGLAAGTLVACDSIPDFDLRDLGDGGFDTSEAVANLPDRPRPDDRGIISYPNYQVAVARSGDTVRSIGQRLGQDATTLGRFNGIDPDTTLRAGELIALPTRVAEPSPATGAATTGPIRPVDVAAVATTALDRAESSAPATTTAAPAPAATTPRSQPAPVVREGVEPIRHKVARGETVFSISRRYGVPVSNIAEWNSLTADLAVREGQFLLIPQGGTPAPRSSAVTEPGAGSPTPVPPSATAALPDETPEAALPPAATPEAPDLGEQTAASAPQTSTARLAMPVQGPIIREYAPGRNEGIDIAVAAGTNVVAADSGTVAAVTRDTNGVAIVVLRHSGNLLTVYTNLEELRVSKNDSVRRGQTLGRVGAGDPSFVHFEVRRGLQSANPAEFLPL